MKKYLTFEEAKELFLNGEAVWYELETLEQNDFDHDYNDELEGYKVGDVLSTCKQMDMGDTLEDLSEDFKYFTINQ